MNYLNHLDTELFLWLNGCHNVFWDFIMYWFSNKEIWMPFYLILAFYIVRSNGKRGWLILVLLAILIICCDQTASHLLKNIVHRLRPSHEPALAGLVNLSKAGPGGLYGFVSSHAANAFGLATFLTFVLDCRYKVLKYILFFWALCVSYSRIYNGVHYPGDVIVAAGVGVLLGMLFARIFYYIVNRAYHNQVNRNESFEYE